MATTVTLTGTGVPYPDAARAGAGTLVRYGDTVLQFDAGRATAMRLAAADVVPAALSAVFVTHVHSDHVAGLADLALTRWVQQGLFPSGPLPVVCPQGDAEGFVAEMLRPYAADIAVRREHAGHGGDPRVDVAAFAPGGRPAEVWRSADGEVAVEAVAVHHEPVKDAVAYRVRTPDATVVVSGDTRVCAEVEELSRGADLLVHEACRATALGPAVAGTFLETIFAYHADTVALGAMAERAGVPHLALTHLIPAPADEAQEREFADDVRSGGYTGTISVGRDLMSFTLPAA
ncbi:MBL fold metallo-hydrolase [Actinomadura parmotrematis]|uniref:MBL fold metallo-hydrolase n=1 Tax=Actinomadura parmotrematis TaxID=2864039 RepID=A0ABS7FPC4_9ACTN|nr:MBL fold metallo-hydrolase [Actinomadura parmotrematis]MBW8481418.1 MBL fold metallo-hydrolase [Actinomadura parmotrematis]